MERRPADVPHFDAIDRLYRRILQRPVDPSGLATYSRLMESGKLSVEGLSEILRGSEEFMLLAHRPAAAPRFEISSRLQLAGRRHERPLALFLERRHGPVAATIASKRYIANARVTAHSFRRRHPDIPFVLLLMDDDDGALEPDREPFEIVTAEALDIPALDCFLFQYTEIEATYAVVPFLLDGLLSSGFDRVVFLKQETLVLGDLGDLVAGLDRHSFFVTPHLLARASSDLDSREAAAAELRVLQAGVFNGGILGVADTPHARSFLAWWMERTYSNCYRLVDDGLHFEQRWLDFLPSFVPDVRIVRDAGVNVGHWNLDARDVRTDGTDFTACGAPLRVFRFSGFDPQRPERVSRYSDLEVRATGDAAPIFRAYHEMLVAAGFERARTWTYSYAAFDNGVPIPDIARRIYRDLGQDGAQFGNPRRGSETGSFYHWLVQPASSDRGLSNLWQAIYDREPAFRMRFPRLEGIDGEELSAWWRRFDESRYEIPEALFPSAGG